MRLLPVAILGCALLGPTASHAESYIASLLGSGFHQYATGIDNITWTGHVTVFTDGVGDGTYFGATLESINLSSNWMDFGDVKGQTATRWEYAPYLYLPIGPEAGASVTITGGLLTSVNLTFDGYSAIYSISGMSAAENTTCRTNNCHGIPNNIELSGLLAAVSSVPEPAALSLLLAGVGLVALARAASRPVAAPDDARVAAQDA